jgi:hypothetical protein
MALLGVAIALQILPSERLHCIYKDLSAFVATAIHDPINEMASELLADFLSISVFANDKRIAPRRASADINAREVLILLAFGVDNQGFWVDFVQFWHLQVFR